MSARVLNPAMMTEMSRNLGVIVANSTNSAVTSSVGTRVVPSRAALARVRRDLFGPVDHVAARALAERELKAQSVRDSERWGFDFRLEVPKSSSRFEWEVIGTQDAVPEPYAFRGMPYLRRSSPATPRKSPRLVRIGQHSPTAILETASATLNVMTPSGKLLSQAEEERTPPQESRLQPASINEATPDVVPAIAELSFRSKERKPVRDVVSPTTPVLPSRKQAAITDFMKSRKRSLNSSTKGLIEPPPEKVSRNTGQIRS